MLEKASAIGAHGISGACSIRARCASSCPTIATRALPSKADVTSDDSTTSRRRGNSASPSSSLRNHGNHVISLGSFETWLGGLVEAAGAYVLPGMAAVEGLFEGDQMVGVRTGDKGIDRNGNRKANFEPGSDIRAKITVLCEGARGSLTKRLTPQLRLDEARPSSTRPV